MASASTIAASVAGLVAGLVAAEPLQVLQVQVQVVLYGWGVSVGCLHRTCGPFMVVAVAAAVVEAVVLVAAIVRVDCGASLRGFQPSQAAAWGGLLEPVLSSDMLTKVSPPQLASAPPRLRCAAALRRRTSLRQRQSPSKAATAATAAIMAMSMPGFAWPPDALSAPATPPTSMDGARGGGEALLGVTDAAGGGAVAKGAAEAGAAAADGGGGGMGRGDMGGSEGGAGGGGL